MTHRRRQRFAAVAPAVLLCLACMQSHLGGTSPEQKPRPKLVPLQIDYGPPPRTWREAVDRADVVAVIQLESFTYERDTATKMPLTRFDAEIIEVIKDSASASTRGTISVTRLGGVREVAGESRAIEEGQCAPWTVGQTLLVFLTWSDPLESYTLPFGPDAAFELDPTTKKVRVFANSTFAGRHKGRDVAAVLAEVKAVR